MTDRIRASEGYAFRIGDTHLYAGPRMEAPNERHLKRPPVLAIARHGKGEPEVVAEFPNAAAAERFIDMLRTGIDEGTAHKPLPTGDEIPLTVEGEKVGTAVVHEDGTAAITVTDPGIVDQLTVGRVGGGFSVEVTE